MWFEKFGFHGHSSYWKLDTVKQEMSNWPENDRKMTSNSNFKMKFSQRSLDSVKGF